MSPEEMQHVRDVFDRVWSMEGDVRQVLAWSKTLKGLAHPPRENIDGDVLSVLAEVFSTSTRDLMQNWTEALAAVKTAAAAIGMVDAGIGDNPF